MTRLPQLLLFAGLAGGAIVPARAASYYEGMRLGDGCPACSARNLRSFGRFPDDMPLPEDLPADPVPAASTTPAPVPQAPVATASQVIATAVAGAATSPALTMDQAASLAARIETGGPEIDFRPGDDGCLAVNFNQLASYKLELPPLDTVGKSGSQEKIPALLRKLDGRKVRLSGFMLPMKVEGGLTTEFLLVRSQLVCCYGVVPAPNEWVCVKAPGKGVPMQLDAPLQFRGVLHVGEIYENGLFAGVYRLDAEKDR